MTPQAPTTPPVSPFKIVALVGRHSAASIAGPLMELALYTAGRGHDIMFERETVLGTGVQDCPALSPEEMARHTDMAIMLGDDGILLGIGCHLTGASVPVIDVNHGWLGLMIDAPFDDVHTVPLDMLAGRYEAETRMLLQARIVCDSEVTFSALAFNDMVINRPGASGMAELAVFVDGFFTYSQRSDGLIASTPTSSTAYALPAGGPTLHPAPSGLVLAPIAPHSPPNRPIIIPQDTEVVIQVTSGRDASVNFNTQSLTSLPSGGRIVIHHSGRTMRLLHPIGYNYYAMLRKKLHWHEHSTEDNRLQEPVHDPTTRPDLEPAMLAVCAYGCASRFNLEPFVTNHEQLLRPRAHHLHVAQPYHLRSRHRLHAGS